MASEENKAPRRKRRKIIRIKRKVNNNNNDVTDLEFLQQQQAILDLLRNQSLKIIASDDGTGSLEDERRAIDAGYRFLWSYSFDGLELKRGWEELSRWRA